MHTSWRTKAWVSNLEDIKKFLSIPDEPVQVELSYYKTIKQEIANLTILKISIPDPIGVVCPAVDREQFLIWCYEELDLLLEMTRLIQRRMLRWLEQVLSHCSGDVFWTCGLEYVLPPLLPPKFFDLLVSQFDAPIVELNHRHGCHVQMHSHGTVGQVLEKFAELGIDALDVLEPPPKGDVDFTHAKSQIGDRVCIMGNIQYDDLERCTPDEIRQKAFDSIKAGGREGFILAPTASPFTSPCPDRLARNYITLIQTAQEATSP